MRIKTLFLILLLWLLATLPAYPVQAQQPDIYLPLVFKTGNPMPIPDPILRVTDGTKIVDLLGRNSGWELSDDDWRPQIAQRKGGGQFVDSAIADGRRLVFATYDNVTESIPLSLSGTDQAQAIKTLRELLQLGRQAGDYWIRSYEQDDVWLEVKPPCSDCRTGYARVVQISIAELTTSPFKQPFFSPYNSATIEDITLIIEREPLWRGIEPGTVLGPLFNILRNSDFELWNFGVTDSQPDSWSDLETTHITGSNNREDDSHSGEYSLRVRVGGSTAANRAKGVTQVLDGVRANTTYTAIAWVRNDGVTNGVGRILVTYSSQLELYRSSTKHGWQLYTGTFTTGAADTVAVNCEILTTAANTDGAVYFDSLMIVEGDWQQEAVDGMLHYISSSHVVNHWDQVDSTLLEAGDLNWVDAWDVPGDESALVRLDMVNSTPDSGTNSPVVLETIRAGMRRTGNVFNFDNYHDPAGVGDTTASGDDRVSSGALSTDWTTVGFFTINDADVIQDNLGRFRVLARVRDASTSGALNLEVRLRYWIGVSGVNVKALESVTVPNRGSWYIVDLTGNAAMNWDVKGRVLPGSLGLEVQMRRATGEDEGYLDYVEILPTDGGILVANVDPSIPLNSGLIVDGTNSTDVYGARLARGWREVYQTDFRQEFLQDFREALYIAARSSQLNRFQNNGGTFLHDYGVNNTIPLVLYGSKLFVITSSDAGDGEGYSLDGTSVPGTLEFTYGTLGDFPGPHDAIALGGYIYIIGQMLSVARMWQWDGAAATATEILNGGVTYPSFYGLGVYKNRVYIHAEKSGGTDIDILEYDPETGSVSVSLTITAANEQNKPDFVEFQGKLYWLTSSGSDNIYRFDGDTWEQVTPLVTGATGLNAMFWHAGVVAGDRLYITGQKAIVGGKARVMSTADGDTWRTEYLPNTTTASAGLTMAVSQGQIFMGTSLPTGSDGMLHVATFIENQYKTPDYQLSPFFAPNREWGNQRRHRYVFSFSREGGVDVVDDQLLIGVGVVPQFLSLVGDGQ